MRNVSCSGFGPTRVFLFASVFLIQLVLSNAVLYNVTGAQNTPLSASKFAVRQFDCDAEQAVMIGPALLSAKQAFRKAVIRINALEKILLAEPETPAEVQPYDMVSWRTFEAIFGTIYYGKGHVSNDLLGKPTVAKVKRVLEGISNAFNDDSHDVEIMCNDPWIEVPNPDPNMDSKTKWDIRPAERGGQRYVDPPSCGGGTTGAYALTLWDTPAFGDMLFIVLCRYPFEGEKNIGTLSNFAHEKLEPWEMETNDFVETLSGVMIHEFFHAFTFLGDDALDDMSLGPFKGYNWESVAHFGKTRPDLAIQNAQSYTFFVIAMYLDLYDWHTGVNDFINGEEDEEYSCPISGEG